MRRSLVAALALLCLADMTLLGGCSPKTKHFTIEGPEKIVITSLSGNRTEVTEEDAVREITEHLASIRFERGKSGKNTNGFGPFISWYDANGELMGSVSVMGDDAILYDDHFWKAVDGSAGMENICAVLSAYNAYS